MNNLWKVWNSNGEFKIADYTVCGFSVAGLRTNFFIKQLSLMLDAGISAPYQADTFFITHAHLDHMANIACHLLTQKKNIKYIYCPASQVESIDNCIRSYFTATNGGFDLWNERKNHVTVGVKPGQFIDMVCNKQKFTVEIIECFHTIDSVGYGFITQSKKIKKELKNKTSKELSALSDKEKYDYITNYEFCYLGDTSWRVLKEDMICCYDNIMIECSFLYDTELERSEQVKHIHWAQLKPYVISRPHITFYLFHFSLRYTSQEIIDFFAKENLSNVIPLANHYNIETLQPAIANAQNAHVETKHNNEETVNS